MKRAQVVTCVYVICIDCTVSNLSDPLGNLFLAFFGFFVLLLEVISIVRSLDVRMAPSWHQNRTELDILPNGRMNLCDIDLTSHVATMQIIVNQYFVAFDSGCTILKEFKVRKFSKITLKALFTFTHTEK